MECIFTGSVAFDHVSVGVCSNCDFNCSGVAILGGKVDNLSSCNFNCSNCVGIKSAELVSISDCHFYGSKGDNENQANCLYCITGCTFTTLQNSTFDYTNIAINSSTFETIDNCQFTNIFYDGISSPQGTTISNCLFEGKGLNDAINLSSTDDYVKNIDNCIFSKNGTGIRNWGKIDNISNSNFSNNYDGVLNSSKGEISTIQGNTFSNQTEDGIMGNLNSVSIIGNTFENNAEGDIVNTDEVAGTYSQNIFKGNEKAIDNETEDVLAPTITSVIYSDSKYYISGTTGANAVVEIFKNDETSQTASEYLGSAKSDVSGNFTAVFDKKQTNSISCLVATSTYDTETSELGDPFCNIENLNYYVTTTGTGTGASWEDPMSPEAFAAMLPLARSGATFHVGAGSYDLNKINDSNSELQINSGITIRGGYPANPVTGIDDKSDPSVNTTSFHTNSMRFYTDYARFVINSSQDDTVKFKSLSFTKATIRNLSQKLAKLVVDSCTFSHAISDYAAIYSDNGNSGHDSVVVRNTTFIGETTSASYRVAKILTCGNFLMEKCNVYSYISDLPILSIDNGNITVKNSTFTHNKVPYLANYNRDFRQKFYFNTIVGNTFTDWTSARSSSGRYIAEYYNNIIGGGDGLNDFGNEVYEYTSNNLTDRATASTSSTQVASFAGLLQGTANADGTFTPVLAKNGGFTNNVKVLTDILTDGTSIRSALDNRIVTDDQRGVKRFDMTCPGAYEADKTVILNESICKDGKYEENSFDIDATGLAPGTYTYEKTVDHIAYTLNLEVGAIRCGINTKALAYYVKTDAEGAGDGSRWEDAMSAADFAAVLPVAVSGATFYVAEGVYKPMLDEDGLIPTKSSSLVYAINNDVTIQGGFSPKAETGAVSDPATYHTIFNGDIEGDDVVDESLDDDGYAQLKASNTTDNASRIFLIKGDATKVNFNGVEVTRSSNDGIQPIVEDVDLNIDYSKFYYNYADAILLYQKNNTITVNHSDFKRNTRCIWGDYTEIADVQNTSFAGNVGYILYFPNGETGNLNFDNIEVRDNKGEIFLQNQNALIKNSSFDNNNSGTLITYYGADNSTFNVENSNFTNNKCSSHLVYSVADASLTSIVDCQFENNKATEDIISVPGVSSLDISNSTFKNNTGGYLVYDGKSSSSNPDNYLSIENCQVSDNTFSSDVLFASFVDETFLKSNTFSKNTTDGSFFYVIEGDKFLEDNTFSENTCGTFIYFIGGKATLKNNTIVNNTCTDGTYSFYNTETTVTNLYNNTIVGNKIVRPIIIYADHAADATVVGNIILGNVVSSGEVEVLALPMNGTVSDNLMTYLYFSMSGMAESCRALPSASNFTFIDDISKIECSKDPELGYSSARGNTAQALSQILEGTINGNGEFVPTLKNNGGTTETVKMISDVLADGTNIRFPRSTDVTVDQRGESRFDVTCPGAYEIPFGDDDFDDAFASIVTDLKIVHHHCEGVDDGQFILDYSNNKLKGELTLSITDAEGSTIADAEGNAKTASSSKVNDKLTIGNLAAGDYKLTLTYSIGSKSSSKDHPDHPVQIIKKTSGALSIDESSLQVGQLKCSTQEGVEASLNILNLIQGDPVTIEKDGKIVWENENSDEEEFAVLTYNNPDVWDEENGYQTAETASLNIPHCTPGSYTISVESQCGKNIDPFTFTVDPLEDLKIALVSSTPASCSNTNDGKAVFEVSGGYNCSVYDGDKKLTVTDGKCELSGLPVGEYTVTYRSDEEGCNDNIPSDPVVITPEETLKIVDAYGLPVICADKTGEASITVSGGNAPYTVVLTDDENNEVKGTEENYKFTIDGLTFGTQYKVKVSDANCETEYDKTVVSTTNVVETIQANDFKVVANRQRCSGKDNGSIEIKCGKAYTSDLVFTVTGTEGDYSPSSQESGIITFSNLPVGKYEVYADVAHESCSSTFSKIKLGEVEVKSIGTLSIDESLSSIPTEPTCVNEPNGEFKIAIRNWVYGDQVTISGFESPLTDVVSASTKRSEDSKVRLAYDENANVELGLSGDGYIDVVYLEGWNLEGNTYNVKLTDECKTTPVDYSITLKAISEPVIEMIGDGNIALSCSSSSDGWAKYRINNVTGEKGTFYLNDVVVSKTDEAGNYLVDNLPAGDYKVKYTTSVAGCTDSDVKDLLITAPAKLTVGVDFDAEAAKCDLASRKFKVSAAGGTAPYVYTIKDSEGNVVDETEPTSNESYESAVELAYGSYKVSVTDNNNCSADYEGEQVLNVSPAYGLTAAMRKVQCGETANVVVLSSLNDQSVSIGAIELLDANGDPLTPINEATYTIGKKLLSFYEGVPADVTLKGVEATVGDCHIFGDFEDLPLDEDALKNAAVTVKKQDQRCYGKNNGEINLSYKGPETNYDIYFELVGVGENKVDLTTKSQYFNGTELTFNFPDLAPGDYELYLHLGIGGCDAGVQPVKIGDVYTITAIAHPFEQIEDLVVKQSTCSSPMNGSVSLTVQGWSEGNCTWYLYKDGEELDHNTTAAPVVGDKATFCTTNLEAGKYRIEWKDYCGNAIPPAEFEINPLEKPIVKALATNVLKCTYDKAYIDFSFACSSAVNKRVDIHRVTNEGTEYAVVEGDYKADNTFRMYGLSDGKVSYKEGTDYELTDADAGLPDGKYKIYYFDTTKACKKDLAVDSIVVQRPYVNLNLAKQDVLCYSQNNGVINLAPIRLGTKRPTDDDISTAESQATVYYDYMDVHPEHSDIRDQGYNHGEAIFLTEADQEAYFKDDRLFITAKDHRVFSDVKSISITSDNMDQADLYDLIKESIAKNGNLKYPLPNLYKNNGYEFAASDWIGFNAMPVGVYTVTVNDTYGCHYSESVEIKGPKDGLRVVEASYPEGDETAKCDATKRRIKMTCTGGYYPYFYNVIKETDESSVDDENTEGSGLKGTDYVADELVEKYYVGGDVYADYTSKMLTPGRYTVSVMDTMGCIAVYDKVFTVEAKHTLDAVPHVDVCDPSTSNKLEITGEHGSAYTLYIGHRTHCICYPNCSIEDESGCRLVTASDGKQRHEHECDKEQYPECQHFDNCLEKRAVPNDNVDIMKFKERNDNGGWDTKTGYCIDNIPSGTIGVLATMSDGCTTFNEYTFESTGLPTSVMELATDSVKCNGGSDGELKFGLYGGHGYYKNIKLDGKDLNDVDHQLTQITTKETLTMNSVGEFSNSTEVSTKEDISVNDLLENRVLFDQLKRYYDNDALYEEAKNSLGDNPAYSTIMDKVTELKKEAGLTKYAFTLNNLSATVNNVDIDKDKLHRLTVIDEQGCEAYLDFSIYQPTLLKLEAAASMVCPDQSARIYVKSVEGGVSPYKYKLNEITDADVTAVFNQDSKPKTYDGVELEDEAQYREYFAGDKFRVDDHFPVAGIDENGSVVHSLVVEDANGCTMESNKVTPTEMWDWHCVNQDQLISTWHDYGNVLVVEDQTDYSCMNEPRAVYDSMKVVIVMNENSDNDMASNFEGIMQSKELYTYGVRECTIDDNDIVESPVDPAVYPETVPEDVSAVAYEDYNKNRCGSIVTPFGIFETSWGISPQAQELYNELKAELVEMGRPTTDLDPIQDYFDQLVSDDAAKRMCFVKFQTKSDVKGDLGDILGELLEQHVNFTIRVVAYVGGCDVITEHNSLVLNLNGEDPFPGTNYKDIITVEPYPNPATDGECTLHIKLSNHENDFDYSVFSLDGKKLLYGTVDAGSDYKVETDEYGTVNYVYDVKLSDLTDDCIVKVTTETNTAAVKVIVKNRE